MSSVNIQQLVKSPGYLKCLCARPGHKLIQTDFAALEPIVLASASNDSALMRIYGSDKPNDIYLFTASQIRGLGDNITKYYDPDNPTAESIAEAKQHCKKDRSVAKIVQLASTYNAGPRKIHETLTLAGFELTYDEVCDIYNDYWKLYAGVRVFGNELYKEWQRNGGYIYDGFGLPHTVSQDLTKDLINRYCQTTGHKILELFLAKLSATRTQRMWPWISDFHDETIWECRVDDVDETVQIFKNTLEWLNSKRLTSIPFKGDVNVVDNLAEIKCFND
jgi:DNA polymerase I-like protein with 3'-5' exonuclease and polymerase domains